MNRRKVLVVGGGAAGLMAAITAARNGASVTVLEHNDRPCRKLLATGNGRCNFTNRDMSPAHFRGTDASFAEEALRRFTQEDTLAFFRELGIEPVERDGYVYPRSGQAASVAEALLMEARRLGIRIKTREHVTEVCRGAEAWRVRTEGWTYEGDAVVLANGSWAGAIPGADGSGYELLEKLGHRIVRPLPALCGLRCRGDRFKAWAGARAEGRVTVFADGAPAAEARGELQLTDYGVSGIPVFQVSRFALRRMAQGADITLALDFYPELSAQEFSDMMEERRRRSPEKSPRELLNGLFPDRLCRVLLLYPDLTQAVKAFPLTVREGAGFSQAQVCSGGLDTREADPRTMESRLHRGLYIAGELLDIDGACGGYNLQWAWSSGAAAGRSAAKEDV